MADESTTANPAVVVTPRPSNNVTGTPAAQHATAKPVAPATGNHAAAIAALKASKAAAAAGSTVPTVVTARDPEPTEPVANPEPAAKEPVAARPSDEAPPAKAPTPKPTKEPVAAPEPEESEPAKTDEKLSKHYAVLAQKQARLDAQAKAQKEELSRREAELAERAKKLSAYEAVLQKAKEDPTAVLREAGLSFEDVAKHVIAQKQADQRTPEERERALREEIRRELLAEVEKKLESTKAADAEAQRRSYEEQIRSNVVAQVRASDDYPMTKWKNAEADVFEYAKAVFERGDAKRGYRQGTQLSFSAAASVVETFLREEAEKQFGKDRIATFLGKSESTDAKTSTPAEPSAGKTTGKKAGKPLSKDGKANDTGDEDWRTLAPKERLRRIADSLARGRVAGK